MAFDFIRSITDSFGYYLVKRAADFPDIEIIGFDWLLETIRTRQKIDESLYHMAKSAITAAPKGKADDKGKKRTRDRKIVADTSEPDEEEEEEPPAKKQKDAQKAGSRVIQVPVDEGCSSPG